LQAQVDDRVEQGLAVRLAEDTAGDAVVLAQPEALGRILGNLIGNALRHAGSAELSLLGQPAELELRIDDHGPGIPQAQLETVFRPFYRVNSGVNNGGNSTSGGSGLGLYIARDLAELLGGHLTLSNRPEGGLRARLVLPRA
jgi:signal transduction histidine kinase